MRVNDQVLAKIREFNFTDVFRGNSHFSRLLVLSYSWGLLTFCLLSVFYLLSGLLSNETSVKPSQYAVMFLAFVVVSPLFGFLVDRLSDKKKYTQQFQQAVVAFLERTGVDLESHTVRYWCLATVIIPFRGSFSCLVRVMQDQIAIDYFKGSDYQHESLVIKKPVSKLDKISLNPFSYLLFKKDTKMWLGKVAIMCLSTNEIRKHAII